MAKKSKVEKAIDKQKKSHPVAFLLVVIFLAIGALGGYFTLRYITKDDVFEVLGGQTITLNVGEEFVDEGVNIVAFGKDISDSVKVENNINNTVAGRYYVKYTVDNFRYNGVVKYRYVIFVDEESENGVTEILNV